MVIRNLHANNSAFSLFALQIRSYINLKKSTELIMDFPKIHQSDVFCLTFIDQKVYDKNTK